MVTSVSGVLQLSSSRARGQLMMWNHGNTAPANHRFITLVSLMMVGSEKLAAVLCFHCPLLPLKTHIKGPAPASDPEPEYKFRVDRENFFPRPKVDGAVISFKLKNAEYPPVSSPKSFFSMGEKWHQLGEQPRSKPTPNGSWKTHPAELLNKKMRALRHCASIMSKAVVPRASGEAMNCHPDYEFFWSRS